MNPHPPIRAWLSPGLIGLHVLGVDREHELRSCLPVEEVWGIGRAFDFSSLNSLLTGIGVFLALSSGYVLLMYRGVSRHHNLEGLLRYDADQAVLNASPADRE